MAQFIDQPIEIIDLLMSFMHSDEDVMNLALASKFFYRASAVKVIRNIRRLCSARRGWIFPILKLEQPPSRASAERIILSNGQFLIRKLDLASIPMTLEGAQSIASIVQKTNILDLVLRDCSLTYEMLSAITDAVPESKLKSLVLYDNLIDAEGASAIAAALPRSMLTSFDLEDNEIGVEGARMINAA